MTAYQYTGVWQLSYATVGASSNWLASDPATSFVYQNDDASTFVSDWVSGFDTFYSANVTGDALTQLWYSTRGRLFYLDSVSGNLFTAYDITVTGPLPTIGATIRDAIAGFVTATYV